MRRSLALAALAVASAAPLLSTPASACDPNRPPWCQTPCSIAESTYSGARNTVGRGPYWYDLNLGVCGT
jgi:hypothetical protein